MVCTTPAGHGTQPAFKASPILWLLTAGPPSRVFQVTPELQDAVR